MLATVVALGLLVGGCSPVVAAECVPYIPATRIRHILADAFGSGTVVNVVRDVNSAVATCRLAQATPTPTPDPAEARLATFVGLWRISSYSNGQFYDDLYRFDVIQRGEERPAVAGRNVRSGNNAGVFLARDFEDIAVGNFEFLLFEAGPNGCVEFWANINSGGDLDGIGFVYGLDGLGECEVLLAGFGFTGERIE